jgi:hypothetical protein
MKILNFKKLYLPALSIVAIVVLLSQCTYRDEIINVAGNLFGEIDGGDRKRRRDCALWGN